MTSADSHRIDSLAALRALYGEVNPAYGQKVFDHLDEQMSAFLARAPMCLLSTCDAEGHLEISPKGDGPGFVVAESERTLVIPDRKGNKLLFGLQNIVANPNVALIFLVPGTDETLRVSGRAELRTDPEVLDRLATRGQPALLAIRVHVERAFFHCARAFLRAELWDPKTWPGRQPVSFGKQLGKRLGWDAAVIEQVDTAIENARTDL